MPDENRIEMEVCFAEGFVQGVPSPSCTFPVKGSTNFNHRVRDQSFGKLVRI
jgi:hypothetical protein